MKSALVLFSGGQDSTTCLAWALQNFDSVYTIGFDYGQRHRIEMDCRATILKRLHTTFPQWNAKLKDDCVLDLGVLKSISETALTHEREITFQKNGLPNTFVPGRNLMFFTLAAAVAYRHNLTHLVGGMCETDFSGYPDCRSDTLKALEIAVSMGMDQVFTIETPLMWLDKAQTWELAEKLGGEKLTTLIREETHTCYRGERGNLHDWGYGCGTCPACELRERGYRSFCQAA
jgi:7-cyano-7-deazaguanine synthase